MVTRNGPHEKQEHALSFTFKSVKERPNFRETTAGPGFAEGREAVFWPETAERQELPLE
jgi:hypothetical protein